MMDQAQRKTLTTGTAAVLVLATGAAALDYPIVDTGQIRCFNEHQQISFPRPGEAFFGQDANYKGNQPDYRDNGDDTVTDRVTGLMWVRDPGPKRVFTDARAGAATCRIGGYDDWRLPSIKELYSLIDFSGEDIDPHGSATAGLKPFIDNSVFRFSYGDPEKRERLIDAQAVSATEYVSTTMGGNETVFGVNFADGRIKGYPSGAVRGRAKTYLVYYVRGNPSYGRNDFHDNGDGTVTDRATGLTWAQVDSGHLKAGRSGDGKLNWEEALAWVEALDYAGHTDWRLPNAKELQSLVDYTRSPDTTRSAAIDPVFRSTPVVDGAGNPNYAFYWTGTTHKRLGAGSSGVYIAFGRSQGWMSRDRRNYRLLDVHGAGSQRSDPKSGDPGRFPHGRGPQGDVIAIYNLVRPVRGGAVAAQLTGPEPDPDQDSRRPRRPRGERPEQGAFGPPAGPTHHGEPEPVLKSLARPVPGWFG